MSKKFGSMNTAVASDDDTDVSDVDPAEMAKMIQDMDELDSDLFRSSLHRSSSQSKQPRIKSALRTTTTPTHKSKSHVSFESDTDFDEDDPLKDLLSLEDELPNSKQTKPSSKTNVPKSKLFDQVDTLSTNASDSNTNSKVIAKLFGMTEGENGDASLSPVKQLSDWLGLKPHESPVRFVDSNASPVKEPQISTDYDKNVRSDQAPKEVGRSIDLFNLSTVGTTSTLGLKHIETKMDTPFGQDVSESKIQTTRGSSHRTPDPKPAEGTITSEPRVRGAVNLFPEPKVPPAFTTSSPTKARESRKNRNPLGFVDPLGLFSTPQPEKGDLPHTTSASSTVLSTQKSIQEDVVAPSSIPSRHRRVSNEVLDRPVKPVVQVPSASAGGAGTVASNQDSGLNATLPKWLGGSGETIPRQIPVVSEKVETELLGKEKFFQESPVVNDNLISLISGSVLEQETAASLARQEIQLATVLQLKQHEDRLALLHHRQQLTLQRQEEQLQTLVARQVERQRLVDERMVEQQKRIEAHIIALASQPTTMPVALPSPAPGIGETGAGISTPAALERENDRLRLALETLRDKHNDELSANLRSWMHPCTTKKLD